MKTTTPSLLPTSLLYLWGCNSCPFPDTSGTAFSVEGVGPEAIVNHVREKYNIVIRTIGNAGDRTLGVRVSTPIYISRAEVDLLLEGIDEAARGKA